MLLVDHWSSDTSVDRSISDQTFFVCNVKERAVVDSRVMRYSASKHFRVPGIDMTALALAV